MSHPLTNPRSAPDAFKLRGLPAVVSGILAFLPSLVVSGAETVTPLVTPSITPAREKPKDGTAPGPVLGFTPPPADTKGSTALPLPDDGLNALPGDPNGVLPALDELPAPITAEELAELANPSIAENALPTPDPVSNSSDVADPFGSLSRTPWGFPSRSGMGGGWPSGFADGPGNMLMGGDLRDELRDGLGFAASLSGTYDTNPSQGYGTSKDTGQGDFYTTLGGTATYQSRASTWTYGATYSGSYNQYFNQSELSGYNQNAGASLNYQGAALSASLNCGIDFGSGANRYYASVVDEISYNFNLNARYRISRKTSITGDLSQRFTSVSGSGGSDTDSFELGTSALWHYSPLTEFGPGIRYTSDSGGGNSGVGRSSIGPTMTVNYQLANKVSLNSRIGMDFAQYDNGASANSSWSTSVDLNYQASRLWGMNLSLIRDAQASYTTTNQFEELSALRLGYNRRIRRANWTLGAGWETQTSQSADPTTAAQPDRDYLTFDTALSMRVFADTCIASIFMRYSDQSGDKNETWDSFQSGFSISRSF